MDGCGECLSLGDEGYAAYQPINTWWWIMVLAFNLNAALKSLVLGGQWVSRRMKAIRFHLINIPARVMERSRQLSLRLSAGDAAYGWLLQIRARIAGQVLSG